MIDNSDFAKQIARKAVPDMIQHGVPPTPANYTVWYLYATGRNRKLCHKIDTLKQDGAEFTETINYQLFEAYASELQQYQEVHRHSFTAQTLMSDLLGLISVMSSETTTYNNKLDSYIHQLSGKYQDSTLQRMMHELVEKTTQMRDSGGELNSKLSESMREVEELRVNLEKITHEANRDPLTGVANRKAFDAHMRDFVKAAEENGEDFSVLMLDIDHFKQFNDKFGHLVGDEVLKIVARELMNAVKGRDVVSRFGGEEFALLLPNTPLGGAVVVAESLRKSIASRDLTRKDTKERYGSITVSIGAAQYHRGKDSVASLIQRADIAMYASKKGGRNRVTQESYTA